MLSNVLVVRPRLNQRRDDVTEFEEGRQYRYNFVSRCTGCVSGNGDISVLGLVLQIVLDFHRSNVRLS